MAPDSTTERAAIEAAITRLLDGTPERSTGALSIVQLAVEADVKRWLLTHKHTDLADEFNRRVRANEKIPTAFQQLDKRAATAEAANARLRRENADLRQQINIYAQVIHELITERNRTVAPANLRTLPLAST